MYVRPLDFGARSGDMNGVPWSIMFALVTDFFPVSLHLLAHYVSGDRGWRLTECAQRPGESSAILLRAGVAGDETGAQGASVKGQSWGSTKECW